MTPERFGELLRRPQLLDGQNATELEELIAEHPWCAPLRLLRYRKAVLDDAPDLDQWRARTEPFLRNATRNIDERRLRGGSATKARAHFAFGSEEEQQEQESFEQANADVIEEVSNQTPEPPGSGLDLEVIGTDFSSATIIEPPAPDLTLHRQAEDDLALVYDLADCTLDVAAAVKTADWYLHRNGLIMEYGRPKPAPIEHLDSYKAWKQRRARTSWNELLMLGIDAPNPKSKTKSSVRTKPEIPEPEVASETLADLLAAQGHTDKAIRMYEQLGLRYPSKKASFASRILALQQQEA